MSKKKKKVGRPRKYGPKPRILSVPCPEGIFAGIEIYRVDNGIKSTAKAARKILADSLVDQGILEADSEVK